ncbi:MAG: AAA family ATPase [Pseudonocardia sp.]
MAELGVHLPESGSEWLRSQVERLWQLRGPVPGLPGVLALLGVQRPEAAVRAVLAEAQSEADPWSLLETWLAEPRSAPTSIRPHIGMIQSRVWTKTSPSRKAVLRLLSGFDVSQAQVQILLAGETDVELDVEELLENPYLAAICTYGDPEHVPFSTVDRALFPPTYVDWKPPVPDEVQLEGHLDHRRIEALITDVLERQGTHGDTVLPEHEAIVLANDVPLAQAPNLTPMILAGLDLDHESIRAAEHWSPLTSILLADDSPAFKLTRYEHTSSLIRKWTGTQLDRPGLGPLIDARSILDAALDRNSAVSGSLDELEERARTEKSAGLSALHDGPLSVLIGPAGTGKTTLLRALVEHPGVAGASALLLAPTGKAKVQLETKVGIRAKTLASHLTATKRYDGETGRYIIQGEKRPRTNHSLVIIDEASMMTEEMLAATLDSFGSVERLILVGDPRQLPPIGAGRPFVDLVNKIRPKEFAGWVRVAPNYVELQVPRRQRADGSHGRRHDLELAAWFGDTGRGAGDDEIWYELEATPDLPTLRYVAWGDRSPIEVLTEELQHALDLDSDPDPARAFALTYGGTINGRYLNWNIGAGAQAEAWQVLSPTRSRTFGTVELNRHIKRTYRSDDTKWSQLNTPKGNIPKPLGPELIVRGDKVMQRENRRLKSWPREGAINYVANGEIGVAIGYVTPAHKKPKNKLQLEVEFSSQPGFRYSYWTSESDDVLLELAWAVTVHKSQGSEFGTTFLVLPARANISRELMYTALTRQVDKVVILHEGSLAELRALAAPWRSETARRLTVAIQLA